jgi:hypothetical protein
MRRWGAGRMFPFSLKALQQEKGRESQPKLAFPDNPV